MRANLNLKGRTEVWEKGIYKTRVSKIEDC